MSFDRINDDLGLVRGNCRLVSPLFQSGLGHTMSRARFLEMVLVQRFVHVMPEARARLEVELAVLRALLWLLDDRLKSPAHNSDRYPRPPSRTRHRPAATHEEPYVMQRDGWMF
jgi:hypothetical protein